MEEPKTARRCAKLQHVMIYNKWLLDLLKDFLEGMSLMARPFPSYSSLRSSVSFHLERLGAPDGYTLGGIRAGATTHAYLQGEDIQRILRRGRWMSQKSLESYLQPATCFLNMQHWSREAHRKVVSLARTPSLQPFVHSAVPGLLALGSSLAP